MKKRTNLDRVVWSGEDQAIGTYIKFLNKDILPITNEEINLKNQTGKVVGFSETDNILYVEMKNKFECLNDWDNVLQLNLGHYSKIKIHIFNR